MIKHFIAAVVGVHFAIAAWHGNAHADLGVSLSAAQNTFVYVVILLAPLACAAAAYSRYASIGHWMLLLSITGAFLFGWYHHYVLVSPDNIHHLPPGSAAAHSAFSISAAVLALSEIAVALFAAFAIGTGHSSSRQ